MEELEHCVVGSQLTAGETITRRRKTVSFKNRKCTMMHSLDCQQEECGARRCSRAGIK